MARGLSEAMESRVFPENESDHTTDQTALDSTPENHAIPEVMQTIVTRLGGTAELLSVTDPKPAQTMPTPTVRSESFKGDA